MLDNFLAQKYFMLSFIGEVTFIFTYVSILQEGFKWWGAQQDWEMEYVWQEIIRGQKGTIRMGEVVKETCTKQI